MDGVFKEIYNVIQALKTKIEMQEERINLLVKRVDELEAKDE